MPLADGQLEALTRARFPDPRLTVAETELVRKAPLGAYSLSGTSGIESDPSNDPAKAETWNDSRRIRPELIRWLCVDGKAREHIDPKGIQIFGARFDQPLDLASISVPFPLVLQNCRLM